MITGDRTARMDLAQSWSQGLWVQVGGVGTLAHAGIVRPRLLADRLGLTVGLTAAVSRPGFTPDPRPWTGVDRCGLLAGGRSGLLERYRGDDHPDRATRTRRRCLATARRCGS